MDIPPYIGRGNLYCISKSLLLDSKNTLESRKDRLDKTSYGRSNRLSRWSVPRREREFAALQHIFRLGQTPDDLSSFVVVRFTVVRSYCNSIPKAPYQNQVLLINSFAITRPTVARWIGLSPEGSEWALLGTKTNVKSI